MDVVNISIGNAAISAFLGYVVVFIGLILLILILKFTGLFFTEKKAQAKPETAVAPVEIKKAEAPGTAGELKLYDTDPKDAAMIMAIVADTLGKPLNQLRFISIKEVKD
jgi:Na+-transporting methylmalonyl-CoA/oxaloacetate decarboxylase gamma subunit